MNISQHECNPNPTHNRISPNATVFCYTCPFCPKRNELGDSPLWICVMDSALAQTLP